MTVGRSLQSGTVVGNQRTRNVGRG
jgi:hypothetical protein